MRHRTEGRLEQPLVLVAPPGGASAAVTHAARRMARAWATPLEVVSEVEDAIALGDKPLMIFKERSRSGRDDDDRRLAAGASAPVLLYAGDVLRPGTVLAAVALRGEKPSELDRSVLRWAAALARWRRAQLHVVHAWSLIGGSILSCPTRGVGARGVAPLLVRARASKTGRLDELLESCGLGPDVPRTLGRGVPSTVIRVTAARTGAGLLVIGHHGEARLGRLSGRPLDLVWDAPGVSLLTIREKSPRAAAVPRSEGSAS